MMEGKPERGKRALRRYHAKRKKAWVCRTLRHYFMDRHEAPARRVGMYSQTPKVCSCFMCGNPRRFHGEPTIQERRAMLDFDEFERETPSSLPESAPSHFG
jgi:DNA-directed RNA polymerase specialized sigma24 family protein